MDKFDPNKTVEGAGSASYLAKNLRDLPHIVERLSEQHKFPLVLFIGELGAGKTTLIKEWLKYLGIAEKVSSPSFSLVNIYNSSVGENIYHIDLYRLNDAAEAFDLGLEEYLYSGHLCFVEWPQIVYDYLEAPFHVVNIKVLGNKEREITLHDIPC